jgi:hypothetical protein
MLQYRIHHLSFQFLGNIIHKQGSVKFLVVLKLVLFLDTWFIWEETRGPYLAVRMWVRTTHDSSLILKYLDPYVLLTKLGQFFYPSISKYN